MERSGVWTVIGLAGEPARLHSICVHCLTNLLACKQAIRHDDIIADESN